MKNAVYLIGWWNVAKQCIAADVAAPSIAPVNVRGLIGHYTRNCATNMLLRELNSMPNRSRNPKSWSVASKLKMLKSWARSSVPTMAEQPFTNCTNSLFHLYHNEAVLLVAIYFRCKHTIHQHLKRHLPKGHRVQRWPLSFSSYFSLQPSFGHTSLPSPASPDCELLLD